MIEAVDPGGGRASGIGDLLEAPQEDNNAMTDDPVPGVRTTAHFSGLTFKRQGDALEIFLALGSGGTFREEKFALRRTAFP